LLFLPVRFICAPYLEMVSADAEIAPVDDFVLHWEVAEEGERWLATQTKRGRSTAAEVPKP